MKKALLLSVVASTMIMAGGDIEPVAAPVEVSNWEFGGQAVVYYQTMDELDRFKDGSTGLFEQTGATATAGVQLRATNKDVFWGIGAGAEVTGVATLGLENDVVSGVMQSANGALRGGWISQAYLTYGAGNTSIKAGRQELPKSLSPFAFSEGWNVFKNTFDSILLVNTSITDTTLVGAWVEGANFNNINNAPTSAITPALARGAGNLDRNKIGGDMADFEKVNGGAGIYMATAAYSADTLAVTGTYYYAAEYLSNIAPTVITSGNDAHILWGDASYGGFEGFKIAGQIGTVMSDDFDDDTVAYGAKIGGTWDAFNATLIYTGVNDGGAGVFNVGGVKTPLYSQMILNQDAIRKDNDTFAIKTGYKTSFGKFGLAYSYSDQGDTAYAGTALATRVGAGVYSELDLTYKVNVFNDSTTLFAGYIYQSDDKDALTDTTGAEIADSAVKVTQNVVRVWGRYNF